jgi:hypothetical protein
VVETVGVEHRGKARDLQGSAVSKLRFLKASSHERYVSVQCSLTDEMLGVDGVHVVDVTTRDDVIVGCRRLRINQHEDKGPGSEESSRRRLGNVDKVPDRASCHPRHCGRKAAPQPNRSGQRQLQHRRRA